MAQKSNCEDFIYNNTDNNSSQQRVRNLLTLKERVAVIRAYDQRPIYAKVARMFDCSWEQIKNIVANRDAIMEFCKQTKCDVLEKKPDIELDVRERKLKFLGECVYETIKRLQYHSKQPVTEELIRVKALEFQDILKVPDFKPNKAWLNIFKIDYNISLSNKQIAIHTAPPSSLDMKDIISYCTKQNTNKVNNSLQSLYIKMDTNCSETESKRLRKLNFFQEALSEYILRVRVHHKSIKLTSIMLRRVALDFNEILKVPDFEPTLEWVDSFMKYFDSQLDQLNVKKPPLSLDLKDILSYCSRMYNKHKAPTVTLTPKETPTQMDFIPTTADSGLKFKRNPIIYLDEESEKDVKPVIKELQVKQNRLEKPPPLKIRKIESINNDPVLQRSFAKPLESREISSSAEKPKTLQSVLPKSYIIVANESEEKKVHLNVPPANVPYVELKKEIVQENDFILPTSPPQNHSPIPTTIIAVKQEKATDTTTTATTSTGDSENEVELPRHVTSFKDVLLLLKPLEEYAMLKENYRAIGLITQLEKVFKNQLQEEKSAIEEEDFIG